eukprot:1148087-Pelagomonas_calceolata.AAC.2
MGCTPIGTMVAFASVLKPSAKGRYGSSLIGMDACRKERLLEQDIQVSENISRTFPDWVFPNGTGCYARHHSRPDAVFVRSIPGQSAHIDPTKIPPQDRDIHLVGFKFCPDTNPFSTLKVATAQHANTVTRLKIGNGLTRGTLTGTTSYTIKPLINLGLTRQKAKSLASKLSCNAIQRLTTILNTRHALHFQGTLGGGGLLGAWRRRAGEGEFRRPGAWRTILRIPIGSVYGFLLG